MYQRPQKHAKIINKTTIGTPQLRNCKLYLNGYRVARRYLKRQESKVSRWHLYKVEAIRQWTIFGRWCSNMKIYLIPWEAKIKMIESKLLHKQLAAKISNILQYLTMHVLKVLSYSKTCLCCYSSNLSAAIGLK